MKFITFFLKASSTLGIKAWAWCLFGLLIITTNIVDLVRSTGNWFTPISLALNVLAIAMQVFVVRYEYNFMNRVK